MAQSRPRVWVSQPLFDDVGQVAEHCHVHAAGEVTAYTPELIADALAHGRLAAAVLDEKTIAKR